MALINNRHRYSACYGAGLWLDFPFTVLLTVPDFMGGSAAYGAAVLDPALWGRHRYGAAYGYQEEPEKRFRRKKTAENKPLRQRTRPNRSPFTFMHSHATRWKRSWRIFPVYPGENIPFYGFCVRKRLRAFQWCVQLRYYVKLWGNGPHILTLSYG